MTNPKWKLEDSNRRPGYHSASHRLPYTCFPPIVHSLILATLFFSRHYVTLHWWSLIPFFLFRLYFIIFHLFNIPSQRAHTIVFPRKCKRKFVWYRFPRSIVSLCLLLWMFCLVFIRYFFCIHSFYQCFCLCASSFSSASVKCSCKCYSLALVCRSAYIVIVAVF